MFGPDLGGLALIVWVVLSGPIVLGMIATVLASCSGAESEVELPKGRYFAVVTISTVVGWSCLAWAFGLGFPLVAGSCFALLLLPVPPAAVGCLASYVTAAVLGGAANWYRCATCRVWLRSPYPARQCARCEAKADRVATADALARFATRLRELSGDRPGA